MTLIQVINSEIYTWTRYLKQELNLYFKKEIKFELNDSIGKDKHQFQVVFKHKDDNRPRLVYRFTHLKIWLGVEDKVKNVVEEFFKEIVRELYNSNLNEYLTQFGLEKLNKISPSF